MHCGVQQLDLFDWSVVLGVGLELFKFIQDFEPIYNSATKNLN